MGVYLIKSGEFFRDFCVSEGEIGRNLFILVKVREIKIGRFIVGVSDFKLIQRCYKFIVGYISISFYAVVYRPYF